MKKKAISHNIFKLKNNNKMHNFTDLNLDNNEIDLLNKGTSFIPTFTFYTRDKIKSILTSETNNNLNKIILANLLPINNFYVHKKSKTSKKLIYNLHKIL